MKCYAYDKLLKTIFAAKTHNVKFVGYGMIKRFRYGMINSLFMYFMFIKVSKDS